MSQNRDFANNKGIRRIGSVEKLEHSEKKKNKHKIKILLGFHIGQQLKLVPEYDFRKINILQHTYTQN